MTPADVGAWHARYVLAAVRRCRPGSGAPRLAEYVGSFRRRGLHAHWSQERAAKKLGVTARTIRAWTKELADADLVDVTRHAPYHDPHDGRWKRRTNAYRCQLRKRPGHTWEAQRPAPTGNGAPIYAPHDGVTSADAVAVAAEAADAAPDAPTAPPPDLLRLRERPWTKWRTLR